MKEGIEVERFCCRWLTTMPFDFLLNFFRRRDMERDCQSPIMHLVNVNKRTGTAWGERLLGSIRQNFARHFH